MDSTNGHPITYVTGISASTINARGANSIPSVFPSAFIIGFPVTPCSRHMIPLRFSLLFGACLTFASLYCLAHPHFVFSFAIRGDLFDLRTSYHLIRLINEDPTLVLVLTTLVQHNIIYETCNKYI